MSGYQKQRTNWTDFPSTVSPITAANLTAWEQAIFDLKYEMIDLQKDYGVVADNSTDNYTAISTAASDASTAGGGLLMFRPASLQYCFASTLPLYSHVFYVPVLSANLKWTGSAGGTMFSQATAAGPIIHSGVMGWGGTRAKIAPGASGADIVFDLHSPQMNKFSGLEIKAGRATTIIFKIRTDVTNTTGSLDGTQNAIANIFENVMTSTCSKVVECTGTVGKVITLNHFKQIMANDVRTIGFDFVDYTDSNEFHGCRVNLNANNAVGANLQTANTYNNQFYNFAPDTFTGGGLTGRVGVAFGSGTSRNTFRGLFNAPRAEGGLYTDAGASSFYIEAASLDTTASDQSAVEVYEKNVSRPTMVQTLTYGATVNTNSALGNYFKITATNGTAFTIANPTNTSYKEITYEILNSSGGALGAITWGANFLLAGAFTNPANTKRRTISFQWNGTNWVEKNRAAADI